MTGPRLALGTAQLGLDYGIANRTGRPSGAEIDRILRTAVELGVEYFDTAPAYGDAEAAIGQFLRRNTSGERIRVGTKIPRFGPGLAAADLSRGLDQVVDGSRSRLGLDALDDVLLHAPDDLRVYGGRLLDLLEEHRQSGRLSRFGISIYDADDARLALACRALRVTQFPFSVFNRDLATGGLVGDLQRAGHATLVRSVFQQGLLALDPLEGETAVPGAGPWLERFDGVCRAFGVEPLAAALMYAASAAPSDFIIVGVESAEQLQRVARAIGAPAPSGLVDAIERQLADVPETVRDPRRWPPRAS